MPEWHHLVPMSDNVRTCRRVRNSKKLQLYVTSRSTSASIRLLIHSSCVTFIADLAGDNNLEMLQCEQVTETLTDILNEAIPLFSEKDGEKLVCKIISDIGHYLNRKNVINPNSALLNRTVQLVRIIC